MFKRCFCIAFCLMVALNATAYAQDNPPVVTSITPTSGVEWGGTPVVIRGSDFQSGATVTFGDTEATDVRWRASIAIDAVTPAHPAGNVDVTVTNPDGQAGILENGFTFVPALFGPPTNYPVGDVPGPVFCADLDGDGDMDLAVAIQGNHPEYIGTLSVLLNNGDGTFAPGETYGFWSGCSSMFGADLDGDGDNDLAVLSWGSRKVFVFLNHGDGTFAPKVGYDTERFAYRSMFIADLDGDGDKDLAVPNNESGTVSVFLNNGDGTFATKVDYGAGNHPTSVFSADLDGDEDNDLAVTIFYSHSVSVLLNNGDGTFAPKVDYATGRFPWGISIADLDGDGDNDLAVGSHNNRLYVLLNHGDGTFAPGETYGSGSCSESVFCADLDGDGDNDLAVANWGVWPRNPGNTVSVYLNHGDGTFEAKVDYTVGPGPGSLFAADLDGDGDKDLAVTNSGTYSGGAVATFTGGFVSVLLNLSDIPSAYVLRDPLFTPQEVLADGTMETILTVEAVSVPVGEAELSKVTADLSPIGGSSEALMYDDGTHGDLTAGDGTYTLQTTVPPGTQTGKHYVKITLEDNLSRKASAFGSLVVYPGGDEYIYQDQMGPRWEVKVTKGELDLKASDMVHQGRHSQAVTLQTGGNIKYTFEDPDGLFTFGYTALEFWINPGTSSTENAKLILGTTAGAKYPKLKDDLGITLQPNVWQVVSIPLEDLELVDTRVMYILLRGIEGTFYIDDLAFVVAEYGLAEAVASLERVKADGKMPTTITVQVVPALIQPGPLPTVTIDLRPIGGEQDAVMVDDGTGGDKVAGDAIYTIQTTVDPQTQNGLKDLVITSTDSRLRVVRVHLPLGVLPTEEMYLYQDQVEAGWELEIYNAESNPSSTDYVHSGSYAHAITLQTGGRIQYMVEDPDGLPTFGYATLEFWINPGKASIEELKIIARRRVGETIRTKTVRLVEHLGISFEPEVWQQVSVPAEALELTNANLEYIRFVGDVQGTFYIDDMRFVAEEVEITAVEEVSEGTALPLGYSLAQNYPNPFNARTTIAFDLPSPVKVSLCLYNIAGQKVRTLVSGLKEPGRHFVSWDGKDEANRDVASGIYLYRLKAGRFIETRKALLLR